MCFEVPSHYVITMMGDARSRPRCANFGAVLQHGIAAARRRQTRICAPDLQRRSPARGRAQPCATGRPRWKSAARDRSVGRRSPDDAYAFADTVRLELDTATGLTPRSWSGPQTCARAIHVRRLNARFGKHDSDGGRFPPELERPCRFPTGAAALVAGFGLAIDRSIRFI